MKVGYFKVAASMFFANLLRLLKIIPNNDPIMGMMLPFAKQESVWVAIAFPVLTMISFDVLTNALGLWTIATSVTYGALGLFFYFFYQKRTKAKKKIGIKTYLGSGVFGVLVFDFFTGVIAMPLIFGYTFFEAFIGQIPFTLMHLATVSGYILIITPLLDKHLLSNPILDDTSVLNALKGIFRFRA